jgi:GT2 family glycosyltransferase
MKRIAVLITCHNRKNTTLTCLQTLYNNTLPENVSFEVFLVDDGSTDGTADAVKANFSQANIIYGDGNLYWNGGMRVAFAEAMKEEFDYYLWLNDDTTLYPNTIATLIKTQQEMKQQTEYYGIAVGSTCDNTGKVNYGGRIRQSKLRPLNFKLILPSEKPIACLTMNGNCVLIAKEVVARLGNLDGNFIHSMGDIDYGLRAQDARISIWLMPGFAGKCTNDHKIENSYLDSSLPIKMRLQKIMSAKLLPPKAWWLFCKRHAGIIAPICWTWSYIKYIF